MIIEPGMPDPGYAVAPSEPVLGFDSATAAAAVGLLTPDGTALERRELSPPGERPRHATRLLGLAHELLEAAGSDWNALGRIAVGVGPGGFTGLRIGIAGARALAQARELGLVGVSSLRALAHGSGAAAGAPVAAVLDARRGEVYAAVWDGERELLSTRARTPELLCGELSWLIAEGTAPLLCVGDGAVRFRAQLEPSGAAIPPDDADAHQISALAVCRLGAGPQPVPPSAVLPDYVRRPDATPRTAHTA